MCTQSYHFDLTRHFFASPEAEREHRASYEAALQNLEALKGAIAVSADGLLYALQLHDRLQVQFLRHFIYLYLRCTIDTTDQASARACAEMDAEFTGRTAFLQRELQQIDEQTITVFIKHNPALASYRFAIESAWRYRPHTLGLEKEELLSTAFPFVADWPYEL